MDYKELLAYRKAFDLSMRIFETTKILPKEETYSLANQIRRSSRSVCANIAETYRKRRYPKHFISKLTNAGVENSETSTWLDFSLAYKYIVELEKHSNFIKQNKEINNPYKFRVKL